MATPQEYHNKITELGLDNWETKVFTISQAKRALAQVYRFKDSLWELKRGIKADISLVWDEYNTKATDSIGDSIAAIFLGKRRSNQIRKRSRSQLAKQRDELIASYREIDAIIDDLLSQLDSNKKQLQTFIGKSRTNEKKKPSRQSGKHLRETNHKIDYYEYIKSQEWREKAEEAKARAGNRCQVCNRSRAEVQLDAHHRTYDRLGNERPEDITVLCRDCHQIYEDKKKTSRASTKESVEQGFCIRCKSSIKLNLDAPYCYNCFKVWRKFENKGYEEKFCHICGEENRSTMSKPVCYSCYKKHYKNLAKKL